MDRLTKAQVAKWYRIKLLTEQIKQVQAKLAMLSEQRSGLSEQLLEVFQDREQMLISSTIALRRREIEYPECQIERKAYVRRRFEEVEL